MVKKIHLVVIFVLSFALHSCLNSCTKNEPVHPQKQTEDVKNDTSPEYQVNYSDYTGWTYNKNIYEVNIRQYTPEGTFKAFEAHLPRLKKMGVGILWLMPIHPIGVVNRKGSLGSYYAVKDYETVNAEFGSEDDFKDLVASAHKAGIHVVIDWVANHTSWDNKLTRTNPDFYLRTEEGNFQPPLGQDWADVIQLDYTNDELRAYMTQTLKNWVVETGIDGIRFDYVDGVPSEFWINAIAELKKLKSDIFLIAEGDGIKYHDMGFNMDYCWGLHGWEIGTMRQIYEGSKTVYDLDNFLNTEKTLYMPNKYHMYFTSNHDENSWLGTEFEQLGESSEVFAVLTQTLYGMPLIYNGQESAMNKRLNFFESDEITWGNYKLEEFYSTFNHLRDTNQALWNGAAGAIPIRIITNMDGNIFAFSRTKESSQVIVLLNLSKTPVSFNISDNKYNGNYKNIFTNESMTISTNDSIELGSWDYKVLVK
ncbi:MAG: alpha-amylase family glycosyl hydrolase [Salinivirgaceae bacterium]|jgi:1,4-alpha-glucan branching enzyme|nr:alpha-amylase family glycosyl hydrolase [Salinivirgaceae bacterium]